jgi:phosphate transport system protein
VAHTDKAFEADLNEVRRKLLVMGGKVEEQIAGAVRALTDRDSGLAERVKKGDRDVNLLEVEIDERCRRILALRQPTASDLRLITTALKIVTDLERIGDEATHIAERALELNEAPPLSLTMGLTRLSMLAQEQVRSALDAFVTEDAPAAEAVLSDDDQLDDLFVRIFNQLLGLMMEDSRTIRRATALVSVAKYLERIGDHGVNVAEMVIYMVRGTDVRHPRSRSLALPSRKRSSGGTGGSGGPGNGNGNGGSSSGLVEPFPGPARA